MGVLKIYSKEQSNIAITIVENRTTTISRCDSSVFPCFERNTNNALFKPNEEKKFKFPSIETRAKTPYASTPNLPINMGTHKKVKMATATN